MSTTEDITGFRTEATHNLPNTVLQAVLVMAKVVVNTYLKIRVLLISLNFILISVLAGFGFSAHLRCLQQCANVTDC